jgi:uncharacterized protein
MKTLCHPEPTHCHPERSEGSLKELLRICFRMTVMIILCSGICYADTATPQVCDQDNCVSVEVVSKQEDLERGLMYRTSMDQNKGMFFIFGIDDKYQFWMKNMHFNLDMLWISVDGRIVYISPHVPACTADPCPVYTPDKEARYVLELNSGYTAAHHWKVGDQLQLNGIIEK